MKRCRIDYRYVSLIKNLYSTCKFTITLQEDLSPILVKRGVRQGDTLSPKLFTNAIEHTFKNLDWELKGININGEMLSHLRYADDIVIFAETHEEISNMLQEVKEVSACVGLRMNMGKTKIMANFDVPQTYIDSVEIETVNEYIYLGQLISFDNNLQKNEISRRIRLGWAAYGKLKKVFSAKIPQCLKTKVYDSCVLPAMTYAAETWTMTRGIAEQLHVAQRAMERSMLGISLRDRVRNTRIRQ